MKHANFDTSVKCIDLKKHYGKTVAVDGIDLKATKGMITTLLGPSGCGKSTTLRLIAGLEKPDSGIIQIGNNTVTGNGHFIPPENRDIGMVFQSYAIWPHMSVFENVAYPLKLKKIKPDEIKRRVRIALDLVKLSGLEDRPAPYLSGGQQQRVALARALVKEPQVLLLDEPLSNLDAKLREHMRIELKEIQRRLGITTVYVTHDQLEALALTDHLIVLDQGKILEQGHPIDIYERPKSKFVADFIGTTNFIQGHIIEDGKSKKFGCLQTSQGQIFCSIPSHLKEKDNVIISIRPGDISLLKESPSSKLNIIEGGVKTLLFMGEYYDYRIDIGDQLIRVHSKKALNKGDKVYLNFDPEKVTVIGETPPNP